MSRAHGSNATALRSALASEIPRLRAFAVALIEGEIRRADTWGEAAEGLGVGRRTLERIRDDIAELRRKGRIE